MRDDFQIPRFVEDDPAGRNRGVRNPTEYAQEIAEYEQFLEDTLEDRLYRMWVVDVDA